MKNIFKYIWQLPQNIVGWIYYRYLLEKGKLMNIGSYNEVIIYTKDTPGGVSLGKYVFISPRASENTLKHEYGHTRQSLMLGPLYLVVIGLPSLMWALLHRRIAPRKSYYWFYTEHLADKLGKVKR